MSLVIPFPENPGHVANLASIALLEAQGWVGTDASLAYSLFEYGLAWKKLDQPDEDGDDILFIYGIKANGSGDYVRFDRCGMKTSTDVQVEWNWCNFNELLASAGMSDADWDALPFEMKVYELLSQHGHENVFGTSYWEGFRIRETNEDNEKHLRSALRPFAEAIDNADLLALSKGKYGWEPDTITIKVKVEDLVTAKQILHETE